MSDARTEIKIGDSFKDQDTGLVGKVTAIAEDKITVQYLADGKLIEEEVALDEAYCKDAVDKAIAASNRSGRKIGGKEAKKIHAVLKGWRGDKDDEKKKVVKEDASEAQATIAPNSMGADKMQTINMAIAGILAMTDDERVKWFETTLAQPALQGRTIPDNSAENQASIAAKSAKAMAEDLVAIFAGEDLSEEFKTKTATLFEAGINARILVKEAELEQAFETKLDEAVTAFRTELSERLEAYLDRVASTWMEANEVAIESSLRNELTESFIHSLKGVFADHYIDVPDDKVDVLQLEKNKTAELETQLAEALQERAALQKTINEALAETALDDIAEGLALTSKEKFRTLAEGVEFLSLENYTEKLKVIKEAHFKAPDASKAPPKVILEDSFHSETPINEDVVDPSIARYVDSLKKLAPIR